MVKLVFFNFFSFNTTLFGHILKNIAHSFFGAWPLLLVYIRFTPSERSKGFVNWYIKKWEHGSWTFKSDHGKRPSSMVQLHNPWCTPTLNSWIMGTLLPYISRKSVHALRAGANQPMYMFIGGKGLGIQQGTSVWIGSPKYALGVHRVHNLFWWTWRDFFLLVGVTNSWSIS